MIQVVLLGSGNVATHLSKTFLKAKNVDIIQVYGRTERSLKHVDNQIHKITNINKLAKADVYVMAVPDDAIAEFSSALPLDNSLVVHTSGSVAMDELSSNLRKGVFYPLQTFSKSSDLDFKEIPVCIEAQKNEDLVLLEKLASAITKKVYFIDSNQRKSLHVAAVFVNNFVNHLYHIGHEICKNHTVPFEILTPLIRETAKKIEEIPPFDAQTGPARRHDKQTMRAHESMLSEAHQEIYKLLTKSIEKTYGKEL